MVSAVLSLVLMCLAVELSPLELLNSMVEGRRSFATSDLTWVQTSPDGMPLHRRCRYDGVNWTSEIVPDGDGVARYKQLGEIGSCWTMSHLVTPDRVWFALGGGSVHFYESISGDPAKNRGRISGAVVVDGRTLGLIPEPHASNLNEFPDRYFLKSKEKPATKDEGGGIMSVTVKAYGMPGRVTWWIDTKRNFNPIRVARFVNGSVVSETRSELALYDDHVWFPRVTQTTVTGQDGRKREYTTTLISAGFDRPEYPALLSLRDIGVPRFAPVSAQTSDKFRPGPLVWDGTDLISEQEMLHRRKAKLVTDADLAELWAYQDKIDLNNPGRWPEWYFDPAFGISKPSDIDEWEKYVRRFCLIRKCDDRQKASARGILDDCRKVAVPMLARIKTEQAKEKDVAKRDAMLAPIADIFTKNLVPRLDALLATAQSQPTTQRIASPIKP